jgi:hypothetical protein
MWQAERPGQGLECRSLTPLQNKKAPAGALSFKHLSAISCDQSSKAIGTLPTAGAHCNGSRRRTQKSLARRGLTENGA